MKVVLPSGKVLVVTSKEKIIVNGDAQMDISEISPSSQEEVDNRGFLHILHMSACGHEIVGMRVNDVDYLSNALSSFPRLGVKELYLISALITHGQYILFTLYINLWAHSEQLLWHFPPI